MRRLDISQGDAHVELQDFLVWFLIKIQVRSLDFREAEIVWSVWE